MLAGINKTDIEEMDSRLLVQLFCDVLDKREIENYRYQYSNHCALFPNVQEGTWPKYPFILEGETNTNRRKSIDEVWASL